MISIAAATVLRRSWLVPRFAWDFVGLWRGSRAWAESLCPFEDSDTYRLGGSKHRNLYENSEPQPLIPLPHTTISSRRRRASKRVGGNRTGLRPNASTGRGKSNSWDGQEAEAGNKKEDQERHNKDSGNETLRSLSLTKRVRKSVVEGNSTSKRCRYLSSMLRKVISPSNILQIV